MTAARAFSDAELLAAIRTIVREELAAVGTKRAREKSAPLSSAKPELVIDEVTAARVRRELDRRGLGRSRVRR